MFSVYGFLSVCVCVHICACECMLSLCVFMGGFALRCAVYLTRIHNIPPVPSRPVIEALCLCKMKPISWQSCLTNEGTSEEFSQHALQRNMHVQVAGVQLGGQSLLSVSLLDGIFQPHIISYNKRAASCTPPPLSGMIIRAKSTP